MHLGHCHNFQDFRTLPTRRLLGPIFDNIDGGADDEVTLNANTRAFDHCDPLPSVLKGVSDVDMSATVMGQGLDMPVYCPPTALQRLFYHQGERALGLMRAEAERDRKLMGVTRVDQLGRNNLRQLSEIHCDIDRRAVA